MQKYVVGFLFIAQERFVSLILKNRPQWQAGKFNGIGGHVEEGESSLQAIRREFKEETSINVTDWKLFCSLRDRNFKFQVDFFWSTKNVDENSLRQTTDEWVGWFFVEDILKDQYSSGKCLPNLKWLIPMAINDILGADSCKLFTVYEESET